MDVLNPQFLLRGFSLNHKAAERGDQMGLFALGPRGRDLINVFGSLSVTLQPRNFYKVKFTYTSRADGIVTKNHQKTSILFKSVKYYEYSKVGTFFWLTWYMIPFPIIFLINHHTLSVSQFLSKRDTIWHNFYHEKTHC